MEAKDEIIIDLLLENKRLKKELKKSEDTQMYLYKEYDKLKEQLYKLETSKTK